MSKRYTEDDDRFIVEWFDVVGDFIGPHDLGRSEASVRKRAAHLKKSGAWAAYKQSNLLALYARIVSGVHLISYAEYIIDDLREMRQQGGFELPVAWDDYLYHADSWEKGNGPCR